MIKDDKLSTLPTKVQEIYNKFSHKPNTPFLKDVKICLTKELLLTKLKEFRGHAGKACEFCQISRRTYENYLIDDPIFFDLVQEIKEYHLDSAEEKLLDNVDSHYEASIIFYLKTQGKKRGYSESYQGDLDEKKIAKEASKLSIEELEVQLKEVRESLRLDGNETSTDKMLNEFNEEPNDIAISNGDIQEQIKQKEYQESEKDFSVDSLFETEDEKDRFLTILEKENKDIKKQPEVKILKL